MKTLTLEIAKNLIGKKIKTFYSGYAGQNGGDVFVVGHIDIGKWGNGGEQDFLSIFTEDGRDTFIRQYASYNPDGEFSCSDVDRWVMFEEIN